MGSDGFSPVGLRVLVVDGDILSMSSLVKYLTESNYLVTTCNRADEALKMLEHNEELKIAIVLTDVNMADRDDRFEFLESVHKFDVPVILMTANGDTDIVKRGVQSGACGYLHKPIVAKDVGLIWKHVYQKMVQRTQITGEEGSPSSTNEIVSMAEKGNMVQHTQIAGEEGSPSSSNGIVSMAGKRKRELGESSHGGNCFNGDSAKRVRTIWTDKLHKKFLIAIAQAESANEKVGPKNILKWMNEPWLTKEQVASHLQKHKSKKLAAPAQAQAYDTNTYPQQNEVMHTATGGNPIYNDCQPNLPAANNMPLEEAIFPNSQPSPQSTLPNMYSQHMYQYTPQVYDTNTYPQQHEVMHGNPIYNDCQPNLPAANNTPLAEAISQPSPQSTLPNMYQYTQQVYDTNTYPQQQAPQVCNTFPDEVMPMPMPMPSQNENENLNPNHNPQIDGNLFSDWDSNPQTDGNLFSDWDYNSQTDGEFFVNWGYNPQIDQISFGVQEPSAPQQNQNQNQDYLTFRPEAESSNLGGNSSNPPLFPPQGLP